MDTELLKTFLEVSRTRHFGRAAESLYLTQSAVSFRIRQLENQLGVNLFTRHRNNIRLTAAGEKLLPYAETLMSTWQAARKEVAHTSRHNEFSIAIFVRRNAYGRQLGSFYTVAPVKGIGDDVPMTFIRAPYIISVGDGVEVLATVDGNIVAARQNHQLVCSFHPELNTDTRFHQYFVEMVKGK